MHQLLPWNGNPVVDCRVFSIHSCMVVTHVSVLAVEVTNVQVLGNVLQGDCSIEGNL